MPLALLTVPFRVIFLPFSYALSPSLVSSLTSLILESKSM